MKKLLLLGGSAQQVIAIKKAKALGCHTILCDYLNDNPGQYFADKFYLASTTDSGLILSIAKKEKIDGIIAYASDPAAPIAAYVAEKLNLPGNPYESVKILCSKDLFREFLKKNNFCTPIAKSYTSIELAISDVKAGYFKLPVLVKPVDSSGSKGVGLIAVVKDAQTKMQDALSFSRSRKFIIEEFVDKIGYQVAGDGLSINGTLVFRCFGNDHFDTKNENPFVPISASFPYVMPNIIHERIHSEIQRLLNLLDMGTSTYNFDVRVDKNYNVYLMEIAPRSGGNYIPNVIKYATGCDLIECAIRAALGQNIKLHMKAPEGYYSYFSVHSNRSGILKEIKFSDEGKKHIVESHIAVKPGDSIKSYRGANTTLGCLIMKFESMEQMLNMMDNHETWCTVIVK